MSIRSAEEELAQIKALLDERVEVEGSEEMSTYERVLDVIVAYESWSDLAIRRLHEIHRLIGRECDFCADWPGSHPALAGDGERIVLRLTAGGLANNYVSLAGDLRVSATGVSTMLCDGHWAQVVGRIEWSERPRTPHVVANQVGGRPSIPAPCSWPMRRT